MQGGIVYANMKEDGFESLRNEGHVNAQIPATSSKGLTPETIRFLELFEKTFLSNVNRLMVTTKCGIGMAHVNAQKGDEIKVLMGLKVPVILRPCDGGYKLIGECLYPYVMYGYLMDEITEDMEAVTFLIR